MSKKQGAFVQQLLQNTKGIKETRARGIIEDATVSYERSVQDLERNIRRKQREREDLRDLHGDSALSVRPGKDFDADAFTEKDLALGFELHNLNVQLGIARKQYQELFGDFSATLAEEASDASDDALAAVEEAAGNL